MGTTTVSGRPSAALSWLQASTAIVYFSEPGTPARAMMSLAAHVHLLKHTAWGERGSATYSRPLPFLLAWHPAEPQKVVLVCLLS